MTRRAAISGDGGGRRCLHFMLELNLSWWAALPLCTACDVNFPRDGKKTCQVCADAWSRRIQRKKKAGDCYGCTKKAEPDQTYCADCATRRKQIDIEAPSWACSTCRKREPRPGMKTCQYCSDRARDKQKARIEAGLCLRCPARLSKSARAKKQRYCPVCREESRQYFADRRETLIVEGRCWRHPDRPTTATDRQRCAECVDEHARKSKERYDRLRELGICLICGRRKVVPGTLYCKSDGESATETRKRVRLRKRIEQKVEQ